MSSVVYTIEPTVGQTRLCLDPWAKLFVRANKKICLCCNAPPVGSLEDETIDEIANNANTLRYRLGLLTGNLEPACRLCPDKMITTPQELKQKVSKYLEDGTMDIY